MPNILKIAFLLEFWRKKEEKMLISKKRYLLVTSSKSRFNMHPRTGRSFKIVGQVALSNTILYEIQYAHTTGLHTSYYPISSACLSTYTKPTGVSFHLQTDEKYNSARSITNKNFKDRGKNPGQMTLA